MKSIFDKMSPSKPIKQRVMDTFLKILNKKKQTIPDIQEAFSLVKYKNEDIVNEKVEVLIGKYVGNSEFRELVDFMHNTLSEEMSMNEITQSITTASMRYQLGGCDSVQRKKGG